jgi:hypothetical protein
MKMSEVLPVAVIVTAALLKQLPSNVPVAVPVKVKVTGSAPREEEQGKVLLQGESMKSAS